MSDEILAIVNHDDTLLLWSPTTVYRAFGGVSTPTVLWQIGRPFYCRTYAGVNDKLMSFGQYTGVISRVYRVHALSATTFEYSDNGGASYTGPFTIGRGAHSLGNGVYIQFYATTGFTASHNWAFQVYPAYFASSSSDYLRWAITKWRNGFFFSNLANEIRFTDGLTVNNYSSNADTLIKAKYLEVFHEHLIAGNLIQDGEKFQERVCWSDIHDMSNFTSSPTTEADFFDLSLDESLKELSFGVTGVKNLGPHCYVYGPKEIFRLSYVGLPLVVLKEAIYTEIGNAFPYSLVGNNKFHAFISDENFYSFDGVNVPKAIGDPIKDYYFTTLSTNVAYRYRTFAYINRTYNEIWWVYCSTASTGNFDLAVVWNYKEDLWFPATVENIHSYLETTTRGADVYIDSDTRLINNATEIIDTSGISASFTRQAMYGTADRKLLRDEVSGDAIGTLLAQSVPYLETKDIYYDDIEMVKEIDTVCIHATYDATVCDGIQVYYSARDLIDDAVTYTLVDQLWTTNLFEGRLSIPRIAGRVFRFKFIFHETVVGQGVRGTIFSAWGENVRGPNPQGMEK